MSKPDPTITANLLGILSGKPTVDAKEGQSAQPHQGERHPAPLAHKPKQAPIKQASGRTRTSNRGK